LAAVGRAAGESHFSAAAYPKMSFTFSKRRIALRGAVFHFEELAKLLQGRDAVRK
jgi:hypothetical protein